MPIMFLLIYMVNEEIRLINFGFSVLADDIKYTPDRKVYKFLSPATAYTAIYLFLLCYFYYLMFLFIMLFTCLFS